MEISIFGAGYVGTVTGFCLAKLGHTIKIVDIDRKKVNKINKGLLPVEIYGIDKVKWGEMVKSKQIIAFQRAKDAVLGSRLALISVGTPEKPSGRRMQLEYVLNCMNEISEILKYKHDYFLIVLRSTIPPGTTEELLIPLIERKSGKKLGKDFDVCVNPEFLRESHAVEDFLNPEIILIGSTTKRAFNLLKELYASIPGNIVNADLKTAELTKLVFNAFHALKITFANEIGNICKSFSVEGHELMKILCMDHKLNISSVYLTPGFAFGGPCLEKDLKELIFCVNKNGDDPSLLQSILDSNRDQIERTFLLVKRLVNGDLNKKKIALIGLTFKEKTPDIRGSSKLVLAKRILQEGAKLAIYEPLLKKNEVIKNFEKKVYVSGNVRNILLNSELCIITGEYKKLIKEIIKNVRLMKNKNILDFMRYRQDIANKCDFYESIC